MNPEHIKIALRQSEICKDLPESGIERIAKICEPIHLEEGEVLTEEDTPGHHAYILVSGALEVQISFTDDLGGPTGEYQSTCRLSAGSLIGEMSILENERRSARTTATEPSDFLCFKGSDLWQVFDSDPNTGYVFMRNMARILSRRLRYTNMAIRHNFFQDE